MTIEINMKVNKLVLATKKPVTMYKCFQLLVMFARLMANLSASKDVRKNILDLLDLYLVASSGVRATGHRPVVSIQLCLALSSPLSSI